MVGGGGGGGVSVCVGGAGDPQSSPSHGGLAVTEHETWGNAYKPFVMVPSSWSPCWEIGFQGGRGCWPLQHWYH